MLTKPRYWVTSVRTILLVFVKRRHHIKIGKMLRERNDERIKWTHLQSTQNKDLTIDKVCRNNTILEASVYEFRNSYDYSTNDATLYLVPHTVNCHFTILQCSMLWIRPDKQIRSYQQIVISANWLMSLQLLRWSLIHEGCVYIQIKSPKKCYLGVYSAIGTSQN